MIFSPRSLLLFLAALTVAKPTYAQEYRYDWFGGADGYGGYIILNQPSSSGGSVNNIIRARIDTPSGSVEFDRTRVYASRPLFTWDATQITYMFFAWGFSEGPPSAAFGANYDYNFNGIPHTYLYSFPSYPTTNVFTDESGRWIATDAQISAQFKTHPVSQTIVSGAPVTFTARAVAKPAPSYQWRKDSVDIPGATDSIYTIPITTLNDAGSYTVVAANSAGTATSNAATLTVSAAISAPAITTQPTNQSVTVGASVTFTAAASGNPTPTFQWRKGTGNISGATSGTFSISSVTSADAGSYSVVATNSAGSVISNSAILTINMAAVVQLPNGRVTTGHGANFSAGNTSGAIQWQISTNNGTTWTNLTNDGTYGGVTTTTLAITNATVTLNGALYRFVATSNEVVATSNAASLSVVQAFFPFPTCIVADTVGNLFVGDANTNTIQKVNSAGQVSLIAGTSGTAGASDGVGATARFNQPAGITVLPGGAIMVADTANATLRRITDDGTVTTFAGSAGTRGSADGNGTTATFSSTNGLAADGGGNLFVTDGMNATIRKITSGGTVSTFAGAAGITGATNGKGAAARFNMPSGMAIDGSGNMYVSDTVNNTIRKITPDGDVTTLAGLAGVSGTQDGTGGGAFFNRPGGLAVDGSGNLFLADTGNSTIRKITPAGTVTTIAGLAGIAGLMDGAGVDSFFNQPQALSLDNSGNIYVADTGNAAIRKIATNGTVVTLTLSAASAPTPTPTPSPSPTPLPSSGPASSGGGGGGAPNLWFCATLVLLGVGRIFSRQRR